MADRGKKLTRMGRADAAVAIGGERRNAQALVCMMKNDLRGHGSPLVHAHACRNTGDILVKQTGLPTSGSCRSFSAHQVRNTTH